jgi:D-3-phosphoglycerate dehydrogenase / 2-oxoglutarate reductase
VAGRRASLVVVTSRSFGSGEADPQGLLRRHGLEVEQGPSDHDLEELRPLLGEADAWIAGPAPIRLAHLEAGPRLRIVARYGTGVEAVDLASAARLGIVVTNTPGANAEAVADHTLALLLSALRHVVEGDRALRRGERPALRARELAGLTVGLIGFGNVGRGVARRLRDGFGTAVLAYDPFVDPASMGELGVKAVDFDQLVAGSDVISMHRPGGEEPVIDETVLARMRPGVILINTARAGLLDNAAVARGLAGGRIGALATDVLDHTDSDLLLESPNVIATPHIGALTVEAIDRMGMTAAEEVVRVVVEGAAPRHSVPTPTDERSADGG